jgi:hypothetical protein
MALAGRPGVALETAGKKKGTAWPSPFFALRYCNYWAGAAGAAAGAGAGMNAAGLNICSNAFGSNGFG